MLNFLIPTKTSLSVAPTIYHKHEKRQRYPTDSVVHVTITESGTIVYTQTETSYSYIASYSTISPSNIPFNGNNSNNNNSNSNDSSSPNIGAIIGGVVGGIAAIVLIGLGFFFYSRSQKKKQAAANQQPPQFYQDSPEGMTALNPTPRHFVAPPGNQTDNRDSKYIYHGNGYYEDVITYPKAYYSANNSVTSDSLPSTTVDTSLGFRQVPNEIDYPVQDTSRHVPNLKEDTLVEPPHTKD